MSKSKLGRNPFKPGPATKPAYLAGRARELGVIENTLEEIAGPRDEKTGLLVEPGLAPVKIVGPRGVGKTTLLAEARRMAQARGIHVVWIEKLPNLEPDGILVKNVLAGLKPKGRQLDMQAVLNQIASLKVGPVSVGLSRNRQEVLFEEALEACMEQRPLALLLDEAMEYDPEMLGALLQISQKMIVHEHPLALFLAGTPNLDMNLDRTGASFIDRTEDMYVNDLTPEATQEALHKPFSDRGVEVDGKALKLMVKMTDNYPFFTQIAGLEVWNTMAASGLKKVDVAIVRQAEAGIKRRRQGFYEKAYGKMENIKVLTHAHTVMEVLRLNGGRATMRTILGSLARDDSDAEQDKALDIFHKLVDRGFIWSKDDEMEAGIPSFFNYCQEQEKKAMKQAKNMARQKKSGKQAASRRASVKKKAKG